MANLVGQLGQTISSNISGSVSNFASGAKSAFVSANPAVFGPALSGFSKILNAQTQKQRREDKEEKQRDRAFDEEKQNESKKLFTDILKQLKEQTDYLKKILEALTAKKGGLGLGSLLAGLGALGKSFIDKFKNLFDAVKGKFAGLFDDISKAFKNIIDDIKTKRLPSLKTKIDDVLKSLGTFFDDIKLRFAKGFKALYDSITKGVFDKLTALTDALKRSIQNLFTRISSTIERITSSSSFRVPAKPVTGIIAEADGRFRDTKTGRFVSKDAARAAGVIDDVSDAAKVGTVEAARTAGVVDDVSDAAKVGTVVSNITNFFKGFRPLIEGPLRFLAQVTDVAPLIAGIAKIAGPLGLIIGIFDGIRMAVDTEQLERLFGKGNVGIQERISGFIGGFVGSIGGLFDIIAKLMGIEIEGKSIQDSLSETIAKFTNNVLDGIKQFFLFLGTIVKSDQFQSLWAAAKELVGKVVDGVKSLFGLLKDFFFSDGMQKVFSTMGTIISKGIETVIKGISNIVDLLIGIFTLNLNKIKEAGTDLLGGIVSGIGSMFKAIGNLLIEGINWLIDQLPDFVRSKMTTRRFSPLNVGQGDTSAKSEKVAKESLGILDRYGVTRPAAPSASNDSILETIRRRESSGNYTAQAKGSTASGAYQFIDSTWQSLTKKYGIGTEYARAKDAPPLIQDAVAAKYVDEILQKAGGDVSKVPIVWYTGNLSGAMSQKAIDLNRGLTPEMYQQGWMKTFASVTGGSGLPPTVAANLPSPQELERRSKDTSSNIEDIAEGTILTSELLETANKQQKETVKATADVQNSVVDQTQRIIQNDRDRNALAQRHHEERMRLERDFYNALSSQYVQILQGLNRQSAYGRIPNPNILAGQNLADKLIGKTLQKALGPEFGFIATKLVGSYADQLIGQTLGPMLGGADSAQRIFNAFASGDKNAFREQLIYGVTGVPTGFETFMGSLGGFGPVERSNTLRQLANDLATITGKPFSALFDLGGQGGGASTFSTFNESVRTLDKAASNLYAATDYSLTGGGGSISLPGGGIQVPARTGGISATIDPVTGQLVSSGAAGIRATGYGTTVTPAGRSNYAEALQRVSGFALNIGSQFLTQQLVSALGVKDPVLASMLSVGLGPGTRAVLGTFLPTSLGGTGAQLSVGNLTSTLSNAYGSFFSANQSPTAALGNLLGRAGTTFGSQFLADFGGGFSGSAFGGGSSFTQMFGAESTFSGASAGAQAGAVLGAIGNALFARSVTNMLSGGFENNFGDALAMIGSYFDPTGGLISGTVGALFNRAFGRKAPEVRGAGVAGTLAEGTGTILREYRDVEQKGGWFRSDRDWQDFADGLGGWTRDLSLAVTIADEQLLSYQTAVNEIFKGIRNSAETLGLARDAITGFTKEVKIDIGGLDKDQAIAAITEQLTQFADDMLQAAFPELSKYVLNTDDGFERLSETFNRLTKASEFMNLQFEMLGYNFDEIAKTVGGTALDLANWKFEFSTIFGGETQEEQLQRFGNAFTSYFDLFYTEEEKLKFRQNQQMKMLASIEQQFSEAAGVTKDFPPFGDTLEESRKVYRDIVDEFMKVVEADPSEQNQKLLAQLVQAAPLYFQAAQTHLDLANLQKKTLEGGAKAPIAVDSILGPLIVPGSVGEAYGPLSSAISSIEELTYAATTSAAILPVVGETASGTYLNAQAARLEDMVGPTGSGIVSNNNVIDNSVKQVSSPRTTVIMQDDRVRDYHPILKNIERTTLCSYMPGKR